MNSTQAETKRLKGKKLTERTHKCSKEKLEVPRSFSLVHDLDLAEFFASTIVSCPEKRKIRINTATLWLIRQVLISGLCSMSLRGNYEYACPSVSCMESYSFTRLPPPLNLSVPTCTPDGI